MFAMSVVRVDWVKDVWILDFKILAPLIGMYWVHTWRIICI